jgi:hypothetical protein
MKMSGITLPGKRNWEFRGCFNADLSFQIR